MQTNIPRKIRPGMWVLTTEDRVGILTALGPTASVDLVDESGETTLTVRVPFDSLRQAMLHDIPDARRPTPQAGAALGYV